GPYAAFFGRGRAGSPRSQTVAGRVAVPPPFFSSLFSLPCDAFRAEFAPRQTARPPRLEGRDA
ncbi:MAG: hypothetical protein ACRD2F_02795, partial [Terriglobales bacterium]